jgi:hypothetical protein
MLTQDKIDEYRANPETLSPLIKKAFENPNNLEILKDLASVYRSTLEKEYVAQFIKKQTKVVPLDPYDLKRFFNCVQTGYGYKFKREELTNILIESAVKNDFYFNMEDINKRMNIKVVVSKEILQESDRTQEETEKNIANLNINADLERRLKEEGFKI